VQRDGANHLVMQLLMTSGDPRISGLCGATGSFC
jgi:hypothetical protein